MLSTRQSSAMLLSKGSVLFPIRAEPAWVTRLEGTFRKRWNLLSRFSDFRGLEAAARNWPQWVVSRSSTALGCAPPILPWTNDWDLIDSLHVEQITIDAD